ncbi:hypothetical protein HYH02_002837 [Chlamydomonas schloesseri]|uniref:Staygreen protein domain-containing protein n=1 Tax=Chlamydomonas schloesseri TaxID=2026947 RepID=A0A836BB21_9CHLO|nr:hypothetical protein HYH02_002837 [Chlamydomonas schloesseri]|eukprot:KAG2452600.1 hypothetical protein HYH02_002837 [Chlamydomonas schloesseri]
MLAAGTSALDPAPPRSRKYTLTHNDITGSLCLTIGAEYNQQQISGFYTRLLRDEVIAEWVAVGASGYALHVYCHVSGEERWLAPPLLRNYIFRREMPLVLDTIVYADRELLQRQPELGRAQVYIHFQSSVRELDTVEYWGLLGDRGTWPKGPTSILLRTIYAIIGWPPYLEALPADLSIDLPDEVRDLEEAVRWQRQQQQQQAQAQTGQQDAGQQEAGQQEVEQLLRQERRKAERGLEAREREREAERAREREAATTAAGAQARASAEAAASDVESEDLLHEQEQERQEQPQAEAGGSGLDALRDRQRQAVAPGATTVRSFAGPDGQSQQPVSAAAAVPATRPVGKHPQNGAPSLAAPSRSAGPPGGEEPVRWPGRSSSANGEGPANAASSTSNNGSSAAALQAPANGYSFSGNVSGLGLDGVSPAAALTVLSFERIAAPVAAASLGAADAAGPCAGGDGQPCSGGPGCACEAADQVPEVPGRTPAASAAGVAAAASPPAGLPASISKDLSAAAELLVGTGSRAVARSSAS